MYDQSCNPATLNAMMRRGDFHRVPKAARDLFREFTVAAADNAARTYFGGTNPIKKFHLKKKSAYRLRSLSDDLVVRKISLNLRKLGKRKTNNRSLIIKTLNHFLAEGVPYKVYRLDIKSFYESFDQNAVKEKIDSLKIFPPQSKRILRLILDHYHTIGGQGLPRGMAISADLSDFLMTDFDNHVRNHPAVYYYGRYVDDILIITNLTEYHNEFLSELNLKLPSGLQFHTNKKKNQALSIAEKTKVQKGEKDGPKPPPKFKLSLDYLGYRFSVFDPPQSGSARNDGCQRIVTVDIAPVKLAKIKSRIVRSLLDFRKTGNSSLLIDRIKYLTSNFYIMDKSTCKRQLSGIYYSYPLLSPDAGGLLELDKFLRNAILSKKGRLFATTAPMLTSSLKRELLSYSFKTGHETQRFIYFSLTKIGDIQRCWKYE